MDGNVTSMWHELGGVVPDRLVDDRLQLHHAVQLLASFGQGLLAERPDDSHRSMRWRAADGAFRTDATPDGLRATLQVASLTLGLDLEEQQYSSFPLVGRTLAEGRDWLGRAVVSAWGSGTAELQVPEYEIPAHAVGAGTPLRPSAEGLAELARWYHDATLVLDALVEQVPEAGTIRCWPHHFDLATLISLDGDESAETQRSVGVGLSPGDGETSEPYFYVNLWPYPDPDDLPELPGPGMWHTEGWVGAVLGADELVAAGDGTAQAELAQVFVGEAVGAGRRVLLGR